MSRPPRSDAAGVYHVMNRGAARQTIFKTTADGERFLALVAQSCERFDVKVLAYCLMTNHYHLLVLVPDGVLSQFMHLIGSRYTRHFNDSVGRDGPLLRARFHALLVDSDEYLACAGRYIHRNPFDIGPDVTLDAYRWSSFRCYAGCVEPPPWLSTAELLGELGGQSSAYRRFVEDDVNAAPPLGWAVDTALLESADAAIVGRPNVHRTVQIAMLDAATGEMQARLERELAFSRSDIRQSALVRVRERLEADCEFAAIAARAIVLAGDPNKCRPE